MNTHPVLHPIVELRRFVAGCLRAIRQTPHVDAELMFDGAKQIADEVSQERIAREERLKFRLLRAMRPDSPGGKNITPTEIAPVLTEVGGTIEMLAAEEPGHPFLKPAA